MFIFSTFMFKENVRSVDLLIVRTAVRRVISVEQLRHDNMFIRTDSSCMVYEVR